MRDRVGQLRAGELGRRVVRQGPDGGAQRRYIGCGRGSRHLPDASIARVDPRIDSQPARLARLGFADATTAAAMVEAVGRARHAGTDRGGAGRTAGTADPDLALAGFNELVRVRPGLFAELEGNPAFSRRLIAVLGASVALNQHLAATPRTSAVLPAVSNGGRRRNCGRSCSPRWTPTPGAPPGGGRNRSDDLRRAYRRCLLRLAARDLTVADPLAVLPGDRR